MFELNITENAEHDLFDNALYIKNILHSEIAANNLINSFYTSIQKLADFPEHYPLVNNDLLKPYGIRFLQVKNFTVFYNLEIENNKVFILRFIYSRRNWNLILGEEFLTSGST